MPDMDLEFLALDLVWLQISHCRRSLALDASGYHPPLTTSKSSWRLQSL